jgi:hypothetical protein
VNVDRVGAIPLDDRSLGFELLNAGLGVDGLLQLLPRLTDRGDRCFVPLRRLVGCAFDLGHGGDCSHPRWRGCTVLQIDWLHHPAKTNS